METKLSGKKSSPRVVVITGASAGVGRAATRAFAHNGDLVGLIARGRGGLEAAKHEIEAVGGRAVAISADVADAAAMENAAGQIERELGVIDVWVNNAMASVFSPVKDMTADEFHRVTAVTYLGVVHGTLAALRRMLPRDRGVIVQIGSALAYRGIPLQAAYCAAKHAIQGFVDSLRCELLHDGSHVQLTMVQMPALNTPQFDWVKSRLPCKGQPVPPVFQPEVAADAILYASKYPRREFKIAWPTIKAVFGNRLVPGLADRILAKNGYSAQQRDEPEDPDRPNNLHHPVPGDRGAHGSFDRMARRGSPMWWLSRHRSRVIFGAAASLLVLGGGYLARRIAPHQVHET